MKNFLILFVLCFSLIACGAITLDNQKPLQPIEVQLLTRIAATQVISSSEINEEALNQLVTWTMISSSAIESADPQSPEKFHSLLLKLSQHHSIPAEYSDVAALLVITLTSRVNIEIEAGEDFQRAKNLTLAGLKGLRQAAQTRLMLLGASRHAKEGY